MGQSAGTRLGGLTLRAFVTAPSPKHTPPGGEGSHIHGDEAQEDEPCTVGKFRGVTLRNGLEPGGERRAEQQVRASGPLDEPIVQRMLDSGLDL